MLDTISQSAVGKQSNSTLCILAQSRMLHFVARDQRGTFGIIVILEGTQIAIAQTANQTITLKMRSSASSTFCRLLNALRRK